VALSEHEQKLLEQMEQALYADDPKFASNLRTAGTGATRKRAALGVLAVLAGLGLLVLGVATSPAVGVAGFTVMLIGAVITYSAFTGGVAVSADEIDADPDVKAFRAKTQKAPKNTNFMNRMEDRWRKRTDGEQ
jgi:hypothetical protein